MLWLSVSATTFVMLIEFYFLLPLEMMPKLIDDNEYYSTMQECSVTALYLYSIIMYDKFVINTAKVTNEANMMHLLTTTTSVVITVKPIISGNVLCLYYFLHYVLHTVHHSITYSAHAQTTNICKVIDYIM